jgi:hypothetical protein
MPIHPPPALQPHHHRQPLPVAECETEYWSRKRLGAQLTIIGGEFGDCVVNVPDCAKEPTLPRARARGLIDRLLLKLSTS